VNEIKFGWAMERREGWFGSRKFINFFEPPKSSDASKRSNSSEKKEKTSTQGISRSKFLRNKKGLIGPESIISRGRERELF